MIRDVRFPLTCVVDHDPSFADLPVLLAAVPNWERLPIPSGKTTEPSEHPTGADCLQIALKSGLARFRHLEKSSSGHRRL